jgi:hypothetical protein
MLYIVASYKQLKQVKVRGSNIQVNQLKQEALDEQATQVETLYLLELLVGQPDRHYA